MTQTLATRRPWLVRIALVLFLAAAVHVMAIWAAPRVIMAVLLQRLPGTSPDTASGAFFPPAVTASSRAVVMPSPDMLYSICLIDVAQGPVHITAHPELRSYWSIALYADNSDNYFVLNDRQAGTRPVDLWVVPDDASPVRKAAPAGATVVVAPSRRGLLLMRVLTGNYTVEKDVLEKARRSLACTAGPV